MIEVQKIRLNKYISQSGYCSRRQADELIKQRKVILNNITVKELGCKIDPIHDVVRIKNGPTLKPSQKKILLMMNKPKGYVCTKKDQYANRTVYDLLPHQFQHLFSIGRLDKDSEGLLLFTNDGELSNKLMHPKFKKEKTYRLTIRGRLEEKELEQIQSGMRLIKFRTLPAKVKEISFDKEENRSVLEMTITEGKKRQIRETFLALKHPVKKLVRLVFGPYRLLKLKPGEFEIISTKSKIKRKK